MSVATPADRYPAPQGAPVGWRASGDHWLAVLRQHPRRLLLGDLLVFACGAGSTLADHRWDNNSNTGAWPWIFYLAAALPLLWRRRYPVPVFVVISAFVLVDWLVHAPLTGSITLLLALYAVGAHARPLRAVFATATVAHVAVVIGVLRWAPTAQVLTGLLLGTGTVAAAWIFGLYVRTRRAYIESVLERANTAERERDHQALLAAAAERARIAREMHDIVAHSISVMVALSDGAAATVSRTPEAARDAMLQTGTAGRRALSEMRRLLDVLRNPEDVELAPQPGVAQLAELVAQVPAPGLTVRLVENGSPSAIPPSAQLAVYRLVQEALTNVLKHGRDATRATVTLHYTSTAVDVVVDNDGIAAPSTATELPGGHGLAGMRERLAVFDGTLRAGPRDGGGWRVAAQLNIDPDPTHAAPNETESAAARRA